MLNIFGKNKSAEISLPKHKLVHGIEIKKVPVGKYLSAMRELEELPGQIISDLFPDKAVGDIIKELTTLSDESLVRLATRLFTVAPEHIVTVLALILDVPKETITEGLTPKELCDVVQAYWALNDMTGFFEIVSGLIQKKLPTLITGYKNGLQSGKPSV